MRGGTVEPSQPKLGSEAQAPDGEEYRVVAESNTTVTVCQVIYHTILLKVGETDGIALLVEFFTVEFQNRIIFNARALAGC